jgi:two-component system response regulator QseB
VFDRGEQLGTVDTYVHYLRRKTDRDVVATVRGVGYRLGTPA